MIKFQTGVLAATLLFVGCNRTASDEKLNVAPDAPIEIGPPATYEASAQQLLDARLPSSEAAEGWIRLFDGHTLYGWEIAGRANWSVANKIISVSGGDRSLLCTSMPWKNFELQLEYRCDRETESGIFLRSPLEPEGSGVDCLEVNLSDTDSEYPTGSIVGKEKASGDIQPSDQWRLLTIQMDGDIVNVSVDGNEVCTYTDPVGFPAGRIGLQHDQGSIEFREIRLRPLGLNSLLDADLSQWKKHEKRPGKFVMTKDGTLHVQGGRSQLESTETFDDFVLKAEYKLADAKTNSGIFFRCIPGQEMMGYECQVSNEIKDGNPLMPADHGTGGIFNRQDARLVAGDADDWSTLVLVASGPMIAAWVHGIQVSNWYDDREADENPRKGSRMKAGTVMIQGHDPTTNAYFKQLAIESIE